MEFWDDRQLLRRLRDLEHEIGGPGFWERSPTETRAVIRRHIATLNEAIRRGLVAAF